MSAEETNVAAKGAVEAKGARTLTIRVAGSPGQSGLDWFTHVENERPSTVIGRPSSRDSVPAAYSRSSLPITRSWR